MQNINSSRSYLEQFVRDAAASLPENALVLDAGAGNGMYRAFFAHVNYESADFCQVDKKYAQMTYVCELSAIPVEDNMYDMVLLTQVLEHLAEPKEALQELYRVLKPGGRLHLSAPLFYEEHEEPFDYYRYTQFGFKYLLESSNFLIQRIDWLEGYYGTLAYQLKTAADALPIEPKWYGNGMLGLASAILVALLRPLFGSLSLLFSHLDLRIKNTSVGYCKNYTIIAIKPL